MKPWAWANLGRGLLVHVDLSADEEEAEDHTVYENGDVIGPGLPHRPACPEGRVTHQQRTQPDNHGPPGSEPHQRQGHHEHDEHLQQLPQIHSRRDVFEALALEELRAEGEVHSEREHHEHGDDDEQGEIAVLHERQRLQPEDVDN